MNCLGAFGSGVAAQIAKLYPEAKSAYLAKHKSPGWTPGEVQIVKTRQYHRWVANMATQRDFGRDGRVYVIYEAVRTAFETLLDACVANHWGLAVPFVGCGLAGGDWKVVEAIIRDCLATRDVATDAYRLA